MGFKVVTKTQNGQQVVIGFVPDKADLVNYADLHEHIFESQACQEPDQLIRKFIDSHPEKSFQLWKLVGSTIVCRTTAELEASEFIEWQYNWEEVPLVEEGE